MKYRRALALSLLIVGLFALPAGARHDDGFSPIVPWHHPEGVDVVQGVPTNFGSRWGACTENGTNSAQEATGALAVEVYVDGVLRPPAGWSVPIQPPILISDPAWLAACPAGSNPGNGWWVFWNDPITFATVGPHQVRVVMSLPDQSLGDGTIVLPQGWSIEATVAVNVLAPSGTFSDDDGNFHEPNIEAIAAAGVDSGCNFPANTLFCPADPMTRAMMAVWLVRAMGEEGNLPSYQGYFSDAPQGEWFTPYAEHLFDLGITKGVGDNMYDPNGTVTRAQMAVFLVRAFGDEATVGAGTDLFDDVLSSSPDNSWYRGHVEQLLTMGITTGCSASPLLFCPDVDVPRDQMASFVARAMGIAVV